MWEFGLDSTGSGQGSIASSCEPVLNLRGSIKSGGEHLSDCQILKASVYRATVCVCVCVCVCMYVCTYVRTQLKIVVQRVVITQYLRGSLFDSCLKRSHNLVLKQRDFMSPPPER
jgi:hypothetical protein